MYPQGVCRIRKPACASNGCAIFQAFQTAQSGQKIRCPAADDLFRVSIGLLLFSVQTICLLGKHSDFSLCLIFLPLFPVFAWTAAFHFSEHPAKVVGISHANGNANLVHSHIRKPKQLLGSGNTL